MITCQLLNKGITTVESDDVYMSGEGGGADFVGVSSGISFPNEATVVKNSTLRDVFAETWVVVSVGLCRK